ncbi:DUF397 domain-containing protein [Actinomadura xylanilytica]|uniref:DUF397 domain-containing protein n=1 Tax=Actinomadura xylanilytica TaxID=887459 RepID=UPI00255AE541|nr:DUF397 domain-containing protein [Actinomadura xylanilytica]MDL4771789.1 DUF397 domain-containing protein [Actinomadura xylanilytica]
MKNASAARTVWRKSSYSCAPDEGMCVEVAALDGARAIRDSKDPDGPRIAVSTISWRALIRAIKSDRM